MLIHPVPDFKYPQLPEVFVIVYVPLSFILPTTLYFVPAPERMFKEDTVTFTLKLLVCVEVGVVFVEDVLFTLGFVEVTESFVIFIFTLFHLALST